MTSVGTPGAGGHVRPRASALHAAGRMCPYDYRYAPSVFDRPAELTTDVLYVAGGLYGNLAALDALEALGASEPRPTAIALNGDFHWFDAEPDWFAEIEARAQRHLLIRGNIETEIARDTDIGAGCGCAYPDSVANVVVERSNDILRDLRDAASSIRAQAERLSALPMHMVARIGDLKVAIVHGDAASLAGWRFAHDALDDPSNRAWLEQVHRAARVDVFASTHTCLAALRDFDFPTGRLTVINNGAAGMPNFAGTCFGLATRIATTPSPHPPLYGLTRDGIHVDAIPLGYDQDRFLARFLRRWPNGSPAYESYYQRIVAGPDHSFAQAGSVSSV